MPDSLRRSVRRSMCVRIEVDLAVVLARLGVEDAPALVEGHLEQRARGDVARHQVTVAGVHALEEVVALPLRDFVGTALVFRVLRYPHAPALAARALADEPELVGAGNGRRVHLDELAVRVDGALLVHGGRRSARADDAVRRAAEHEPRAAGGQAHRIRRIGLDAHRAQVLGDNADGDAVVVAHEPQEVPQLQLAHHLLARDADALVVHHVGGLEAAHLLVERVEQLLAGGGAGKSGAVEQRAAESPEVEQPFRRAVERHTHAVQKLDDARRGVGHALDRRLIGEEVAAVHRLFQMDARTVAFALGVHAGVDAALRADRVRALDGYQADEQHRHVRFAQLDGRHQPGKPAADDDHTAHAPAFALDGVSCRHGLPCAAARRGASCCRGRRRSCRPRRGSSRPAARRRFPSRARAASRSQSR